MSLTKNDYWVKDGKIRCYGCDEWISEMTIDAEDGYCPRCESPIDLLDAPYVGSDSEEETS